MPEKKLGLKLQESQRKAKITNALLLKGNYSAKEMRAGRFVGPAKNYEYLDLPTVVFFDENRRQHGSATMVNDDYGKMEDDVELVLSRSLSLGRRGAGKLDRHLGAHDELMNE